MGMNEEQFDELVMLLSRIAKALESIETLHNTWAETGVPHQE